MTGLKGPPEASCRDPDWDSACADLLHERVSPVLVTLSFLSQTVPTPFGSTLICPHRRLLRGLRVSSHSLHFSVEIHLKAPSLVPEAIGDKACGSDTDHAPCLTVRVPVKPQPTVPGLASRS